MKYAQLLKAIDSATQHLVGHAALAINQALVVRNWLIGGYIVEFEQHGRDRARYGSRLLERLAEDLGKRQLPGLDDPRSLRDCRNIYRIYPRIRGTLSREFHPPVRLANIQQTLPVKASGKTGAVLIRGTLSREIPTPLSPQLIIRLSWSMITWIWFFTIGCCAATCCWISRCAPSDTWTRAR